MPTIYLSFPVLLYIPLLLTLSSYSRSTISGATGGKWVAAGDAHRQGGRYATARAGLCSGRPSRYGLPYLGTIKMGESRRCLEVALHEIPTLSLRYNNNDSDTVLQSR